MEYESAHLCFLDLMFPILMKAKSMSTQHIKFTIDSLQSLLLFSFTQVLGFSFVIDPRSKPAISILEHSGSAILNYPCTHKRLNLSSSAKICFDGHQWIPDSEFDGLALRLHRTFPEELQPAMSGRQWREDSIRDVSKLRAQSCSDKKGRCGQSMSPSAPVIILFSLLMALQAAGWRPASSSNAAAPFTWSLGLESPNVLTSDPDWCVSTMNSSVKEMDMKDSREGVVQVKCSYWAFNSSNADMLIVLQHIS